MIYEGNGHVGNPFIERKATLQEHLDASDQLREPALASLRRRDLVVASEIHWGIVAHMLQAIAERHGLEHRSSQNFREIIGWVVKRTNDQYLAFLFNRTYMLHRNFYRIVLTQTEIREFAECSIQLADRIREFAED